MRRPEIAVVGGGLAGLRAALSCADAGAQVTLLEARARLGGATFSTRMHGLEVDNGQHVFLRCCSAYLELIERLGVVDRVELQPRLAIPVLAPGHATMWLRRSALPRPAQLLPSLLRFRILSPMERLRAARNVQRLARLDPDEPELDRDSLGDWLGRRGESDRAIDTLWDLLIRPTLNVGPRDASLALAAKVVRTGVFGGVGAADIGWASVPLRFVHDAAAQRALEKQGARIERRCRVEAIVPERDGRFSLRTAEGRFAADAVVLAVPHDVAAELLPREAGVDCAGLLRLGASPIVNLHVVFDRRVVPFEVVACLESPLQWIFDRTRAAGADRGQYLAVSLSAADAWLGMSRRELADVFLPAFAALFPRARQSAVTDFFATAEPRATWLQGPGTRRHRPRSETALPGLFLAGAWTDTGWPATMEGAVRSGLEAGRAALRHTMRVGARAFAGPVGGEAR